MTILRPFLAVCGLLLLAVSPSTANPILGVGTGTAGFVGQTEFGPLDQPTLVTSYGSFLSAFGGSTAGLPNPHLAPSVAAFFANGGQRLYVVRAAGDDDASLIGVDAGPGQRTGLQALRDVDEISIVAIPGATALGVQVAMIAHCEDEGDRMAILDPDTTDDVDAVLAQRASLGSLGGYAALYFPWIQAVPTGVPLLLPPSGFVAGIYASTEAKDSPIGSVATATDVSFEVTTAQQDILNLAGVNAIRSFPGQGILVWGARTISSDPEWRYVAIRRTALFLEESIYEGTEWALAEPNDATLWADLEQCVDIFLYDLWLDGWFQGATPEDAYFVRVDSSTMTPQDIAEGRTIILVGYAPLRPAEFLLFQVVHQRQTGTAAPSRDPAGFRLRPAFPNPFNPRTTIRFDLGTDSPVELRIFDLAGRLVRTLASGRMPAGSHQVEWRGHDDRGAAVASGVYVYRLNTGSFSASHRITLVE